MAKNIEEMTFDEAIEELENILSVLQGASNETDGNMSSEEVEGQLERADQLKNYCKKLLEKEREDIIRTAKENNIPLDEIGLDEDALDIDFDFEDGDDEESGDDSDEDR
jgi:exonuclease VII small subunit